MTNSDKICCLCDFEATSRSALEEHIFEGHPQIFRGRINDLKSTTEELEMKFEVEKSDFDRLTGNGKDDQPEIPDIKNESPTSLKSPEVEFNKVTLKTVEQVRRRLFSDSTVENSSELTKIDSVIARSRKATKKLETELHLEKNSLENPSNSTVENNSEDRGIDTSIGVTTRSKKRSNILVSFLKNSPQSPNNSTADNSELTEVDLGMTVCTTKSKRRSKTIETLMQNSLEITSNSRIVTAGSKKSSNKLVELHPKNNIHFDQPNNVDSTVENLTANRSFVETKVNSRNRKEVPRPLVKKSLRLNRSQHQLLTDKVTN